MAASSSAAVVAGRVACKNSADSGDSIIQNPSSQSLRNENEQHTVRFLKYHPKVKYS